jgi:hypothetical protein
VDWDALLPSAAKVLGRSVSSSLDDAGWPCLGLESWVACAAEFVKQGTHPNAGLRDAAACGHASISFLVAAPQECLFHLKSTLAISRAPKGDFGIASGTFHQWRTACAQGLVRDSEGDLKQLLCLVIAWFEKLGYGSVFGGYEKMHTKDGLYYLEAKR